MAGAPPDSPLARVDPNAHTSPWAGVVAVRVRDGTFSGALVHRRPLLTAAHVVAGVPPSIVQVQLYATDVPLGTLIGAGGVLLSAVEGWIAERRLAVRGAVTLGAAWQGCIGR